MSNPFPLASTPPPAEFVPFVRELPEEDESKKPTHRICKHCNVQKPIRSFNKIDRTRYRKECNRCVRARRESKKLGIDIDEYLTYSNGPCEFCGQPDAKTYFHERGGRTMHRACSQHRTMFRAYNQLDLLLLMDKIMTRFPFWLKALKDSNLSLFNIDDAF